TFAEMGRRTGKPVVLVANKAETRGAQGGMLEGWELGLGEPIPISAEHGEGMPDLREAIIEALGEERALGDDEEEAAAVASTGVLIGEDIDDPDAATVHVSDATKPLRHSVVCRPYYRYLTTIPILPCEDRSTTGH